MVADPTSAVGAHLGNGVVQVYVLHSDYLSVAKFEVQCSKAVDGIYQRFSNRYFTGPDGFIYGFVPGSTIYMQVRAYGVDNTISNWVQVNGGKITRPVIPMFCQAIVGSRIEPGSLFTASKSNRIFGVQNIDQINF